jgi:primase-polymerase (primpol)-like protein
MHVPRRSSEHCDSWTERSPSGSGLHIFVRGRLSRALKGPQIEVYADARYIAITGHWWSGTPGTLRHQQAYLVI